MIIEHHERLTDEQKLQGVWELLRRYDRSFVPPLSSRENTHQSHLAGSLPVSPEPRKYFEILQQQSFFLALQEDRVVGFMSYRPHYICQELEDHIDTTYITTIIVEEEQRGRGITTSFYRKMFHHLAESPAATITTRTWSTNNDHIRILDKLGFAQIKRITDARGQGVDTIYFRKTTEGDCDHDAK